MGMRIDYAGFAVAGSYADWRKSGTPKERKYGAKYGADYWTLGGAYEYRDTNMSVTYFKGKRANVFLTDALLTTTVHETGYNRNHFLSFGVDHALVPGFMPYAEVTYFKNKRHGDTQHNKGQVMIVGTKLSF
jgi:predicted porin